MSARRVVGLGMVLFGVILPSGGCLENLNQQKYFANLHADAPVLAQRVERHRDRIEDQLREVLQARAPAAVTHVGLWGESWDTVRQVTDGERLFMRGRLFHEGRAASTYYLAFTVAEDGTVTVLEDGVYGVRGPK